MNLKKILSGGQNGADQAGLVVGKRFGLETGGFIPKGWKTLEGPRPDFERTYGLVEHSSTDYAPRTHSNVEASDGTVRLAGDFTSAGEKCTLRSLKLLGKPHFDVDLADPPPVDYFVSWLNDNNISVLNVAGNAESTFARCHELSVNYLTEAFFKCGLEIVITDDDIFRAFGIKNPNQKIVYTTHREIVDKLRIRQIGIKV